MFSKETDRGTNILTIKLCILCALLKILTFLSSSRSVVKCIIDLK